jgi:aspartyl-tRNA(Asn)/glutamyl-tRNA(Gln) amidotransferase subunit A
MAKLTDLTIAELRDGYKARAFSARDVATAYVAAVEDNRSLNAFIVETPELALSQAAASDAKFQKGEAGALEGIPLGIKDLFCTNGVQTTAGSHILEGFKPPYESTVTKNLFDAGATMLGKLNLDEFAMGSANITSYFGPVKNPWKRKDGKDLVPGGSSGGSAASVAAHIVAGATGTDTGGSIRQPASFTGIVGIKPTYGRCSRWGIVAFASSLDQAGPMTRDVRDAAIMLGAMAGHDPKDSPSVPVPVPKHSLKLNLHPLRQGSLALNYPHAGHRVLLPALTAMWQAFPDSASVSRPQHRHRSMLPTYRFNTVSCPATSPASLAVLLRSRRWRGSSPLCRTRCFLRAE